MFQLFAASVTCTLPSKEHTPQLLMPMYADMLHLAGRWHGMALFYNGAKCGASAPDHAHLQAVRLDDIPLCSALERGCYEFGEAVCGADGGRVYNVKGYTVPLFVITAKEVSCLVVLFERLLAVMPATAGELEPRMNVISYYVPTKGYVTILIPRAKHRPDCYFAEGATQLMVSPGALDMAGIIVTPRKEDFEKITAEDIRGIMQEVGLSQENAQEIITKFRNNK